ncbi:MAG: hypothetical protein AB1546_14110 [bacterium]
MVNVKTGKMEIEEWMDITGGQEYLLRSVAIVTLLYERGILDELIDAGRLTVEEVEERMNRIKEMYPGFEKGKKKKK